MHLRPRARRRREDRNKKGRGRDEVRDADGGKVISPVFESMSCAPGWSRRTRTEFQQESHCRQDQFMPRAYWKGFLRLSLVTCPIELFPATSQSEKTHFHQINTQTGHRLRQQMVDKETGRVVDAKHTGRGYELTKGKYVEIEEKELKAIQIESTHTVEIDGFVVCWACSVAWR